MSNKNTLMLILFFVSFISITCIVEADLTDFEISLNKTYGGKLSEAGSYAVETSDYGYMVVGTTSSYGAGESDVWLLKIDSDGNHEWNKTYGTTGSDDSQYIILTDDDCYLIAARTNYGEGDSDLLILKVDQEGELVWNRTMGGSGDEWMWEIVETGDGGYALAGRTDSYGAGLNDYWLMKIDSEGYPEWNVTLGGSEDERARSLLVTEDGGFLVNGWSGSYGNGMLDFWLVKTDIFGSPQWNVSYGGSGVERGVRVKRSLDGGYLLTGSTNSYGAGMNDFYLVKTDLDGNLLLNASFGGELGETAFTVFNTVDGGFILVGYTESFGAGGRDIYMVASDSEGNLLWDETFGGSDYDDIDFVIKTFEQGYLIGGTTRSYGDGEEDLIVIKLSPILQEPEPEPEGSGGIPGFQLASIMIGITAVTLLTLLTKQE